MKNKIIGLSSPQKPDPLEYILDILSRLSFIKAVQESPTLPFEASIYNDLLNLKEFKNNIPTRNIYNIGNLSIKELFKDKQLTLDTLNYIISKTKKHEIGHLLLISLTLTSTLMLNFDAYQKTMILPIVFVFNIMPIILQRATRQRMYDLIHCIEGTKNNNRDRTLKNFKSYTTILRDENSFLPLT
ncbi:MAG: hypothetical protein WCH76_05735 [Candidatus Riflemargulisbacteria bacterium]